MGAVTAQWRRQRRISRAVKRAVDVVAAASGLVVLAPLMTIIAISIRLTMGPPVLFRQTRPGFRGRSFRLVKFRTMRDDRGPDGGLLPDSERVSRLGALLRRMSLDELPELWNVVAGDMSLVGPRPLLMRYLPHYTSEQARRHDVRPGLTGWAQVNGRRAITMADRFALDVWYVDHWSVALDARIIVRTVGMVVGGRGVEPPETGVTDPFQTLVRQDNSSGEINEEGGSGPP